MMLTATIMPCVCWAFRGLSGVTTLHVVLTPQTIGYVSKLFPTIDNYFKAMGEVHFMSRNPMQRDPDLWMLRNSLA